MSCKDPSTSHKLQYVKSGVIVALAVFWGTKFGGNFMSATE